ncbi:hypothetical protein PMIN03_008254 [Paraphaeosphaeria minitans]
MASKAFSKRLGFKRRNTDQEPVTVTELSHVEGESSASRTTAAAHGDANSIIDDVVRDISETEANHRLNAFRQDHKWDPNMPDEAIDMVDAVTGAHDHKGEAQPSEKSSRTHPTPRSALSSATTTKTYPPAPCEPGFWVFS